MIRRCRTPLCATAGNLSLRYGYVPSENVVGVVKLCVTQSCCKFAGLPTHGARDVVSEKDASNARESGTMRPDTEHNLRLSQSEITTARATASMDRCVANSASLPLLSKQPRH